MKKDSSASLSFNDELIIKENKEHTTTEDTAIQKVDQNSNKCRRYFEAARKRCIII